MFLRTRKAVITLLAAVFVLAAAFLCVVFAHNSAPTAQAQEVTTTIYWGCNNSKIFLSANESDVADCDQKGSFESGASPKWKDKGLGNITSVEIISKIAPSSTAFLFADLERCEEIINFKWLDTTNLKTAHYMFRQCRQLKSLDLLEFKTDNVTSMYGMFYACASLTELNLSNFNTSRVSNLGAMFYGCQNLTNITFGTGFVTENIENMTAMFFGCGKLTAIDLSGFKTNALTLTREMFRGCSALEAITFNDGFNTENVTAMDSMFQQCIKLKSITFGKGFSTKKVEAVGYMFKDCGELTSLDLSGFSLSNFKSGSSLFEGCTKLNTINAPVALASSWNYLTLPAKYWNGTENVTEITSANGTLGKTLYKHDSCSYENGFCTVCSAEALIHWGVTAENTLIISGNDSDISNCTTKDSFSPSSPSNNWSGIKNTVTAVEVKDGVVPAYTRSWFSDFTECATIDLTGLDTSAVTDMSNMFYGCTKLTAVTFGDKFVVDKVADMASMFYRCSALEQIDLSHFNAKSVRTTNSMFCECSKLQAIDLSGFDITLLENATSMFHNCTALSTIKAPNAFGSVTISTPTYNKYSKVETVKFWNGNNDITEITAADKGIILKRHDGCVGGAATCSEQAICDVCNKPYGEFAEHSLSSVQERGADCTADGVRAHDICSVCNQKLIDGVVKTDEELKIPALGHSYGEWTTALAPTCTAEGSKKQICTRCDAENTAAVAIDKNAHSWNSGEITTVPTCTEEGVKTFTCSHNTAHTRTESVAALGHEYETEFTVDIQPTCTEKGSKSRHCKNCGDKTEVTGLDALGHDFGEWVTAVAPTCTAAGSKKQTCSRCDAENTEAVAIDENAHSYGEWTETKAATCTDKGEEARVCAHNGEHKETRETAVNEAAHLWNDGEITTAPTCTETGVKTYTCTHNSAHTRQEAVAAHGHSYGDNAVRVEPDCTAEGSVTRTCEACGERSVEKIPALGHSFGEWVTAVAPTCTAAGSKKQTCSRCDAENTETVAIDPEAHGYGEWTVTKAATCTESGEETRVCAHNGEHKQTREVTATGHSFGGWIAQIEATATASGTKGHKDCSVCNKHFDSDGKEISDLVIPATGVTVTQYTVIVIGGTIKNAESNSVKVNENGTVTIVASEIDGKVFKGWSADGGKTILSEQAVYTLTVTGNMNLIAVYDLKTEEKGGGLSGGAIAGITVASIIVFLIIAYVLSYFLLYRKGVLKGRFCDGLFTPMNAIFNKKN